MLRSCRTRASDNHRPELLLTSPVSSSIPTRQALTSSAVWHPADITSTREWAIDLTDDQRGEIVTATRRAAAGGAIAADLRRDDFALAAMQPAFEAWSAALGSGLGFLLLRGFPVDLLDPGEIEMAYVGFGMHFGRPVGQNAAADLLTHIRDERLAESGPTVRLYRTRKRQDFHTDAADLVGLLCLHRAASGGESRIASSAAIYNEILRRRPDLLEVLYEPMCWDRNGEESVGEAPFFSLAPLHDVDGVPRVFYVGWYIRDAQRHADAPRLTGAQIEAMDLLESIANDPAFHIEMDFRPGDIQLLNNARILHAREAYEDHADPAQRRHLLRLWLAADRFASLEAPLREGIARQQR